MDSMRQKIMPGIIGKIRLDLIGNRDEKIQKGAQHFFKEAIKVHGVKTALVQKIAKGHFKAIKDEKKAVVFNLCEDLWRSGFMEESFVACLWSYSIRNAYEPKDFKVFERWVNTYVTNWASCDTLCNHTIGTFVTTFPAYLSELKRWAESKNRWMRRAAAVSLIVPARQGKFLSEIFAIADTLLLDSDDLVQKGYGWMLKAASQAHRTEVFEYVLRNKATMPRTALRYAIEKMPPELRAAAMKKEHGP
jgi:3-methyladenine DNA glycosylase AlkD